MPSSIMTKLPLARTDMLLPDADNFNALRIRDEFLWQPDTAVIRTGNAANVHEVPRVRSVASHGKIANPV